MKIRRRPLEQARDRAVDVEVASIGSRHSLPASVKQQMLLPPQSSLPSQL